MPKLSNSFLLAGVLPLLLALPLQAQQAADQAPQIVTHIERKVLRAKYKLINPSAVDERGLHFQQPKLDGLSQNFHIGAQASVPEAERVWRDWPTPENAVLQKIEGVADHVKAWKWKDEEYYHVALQRVNVTAGFDWRGNWTEALKFARELDAAIESDRALAPRGPLPMTPLVHLASPALLAAGERLPIFYQRASNPQLPKIWSQPSLISMATQGVLRSGTDKPSALEFTPTPKMNSQARTQTVAALPAPGTSEVALTFVTYGGTVFQESVTTRVLPPAQAKELRAGQVWELPGKAVYFAAAGAKWSETPEKEREQIWLEHDRLHRYGSIGGEGIEAKMKRLAAWNEIAATLRPAWLPPSEAVQVFRNKAQTEHSDVAYAAYQRGDYRFIWMTESGQQSWLYVEWKPAQKELQATELLLSEFLVAVQDTHNGFLTRTIDRSRAVAPDATAEPMRVLLLHISRPAQVHLSFPGYY